MNLDLTDEQLAIQETVREFVDRRIMAQRRDITHIRGPVVVVLPRIPA